MEGWNDSNWVPQVPTGMNPNKMWKQGYHGYLNQLFFMIIPESKYYYLFSKEKLVEILQDVVIVVTITQLGSLLLIQC